MHAKARVMRFGEASMRGDDFLKALSFGLVRFPSEG